MEKVKVVKAIPGLLKVGDVLISPAVGCDFNLEETVKTSTNTSERYVSLDYVTVSSNIPQFFVFDLSDFENKCIDCDACTCGDSEPCFYCDDYDIAIMHTNLEVAERYEFFQEQFANSRPNSEQAVVFQNLMWFIEWLYGYKELV
jgi:hypothetical protein